MTALWWFGCILAFVSMGEFFTSVHEWWEVVLLVALMASGAGIMYVCA